MAIDRKAVLERVLPSLKAHAYRITSPGTRRYNCAAWANGDAARWWQAGMPGYFWPDGVPSDGTLEAYMKLFALCEFEECADGSFEDEMEKIALYAIGYSLKHVARQVENGKWTSKLGTLEDIEHESLDAICGDDYGGAVKFMKRRRGSKMAGKRP